MAAVRNIFFLAFLVLSFAAAAAAIDLDRDEQRNNFEVSCVSIRLLFPRLRVFFPTA